DIQTEQLAWDVNFDTGVLPMALEAAPNGSTRRIFVQVRDLPGFAVVDFKTHKEVERIKFPEEFGGFMVKKNKNYSLSHGIGITPDGKTLWLCGRAANTVFASSLPDLKLLGHVPMPGSPPLGGQPRWLTITPDGKSVYVSNSAINLVVAIDAKTM